MILPKFTVKLDKQLDLQSFLEFFQEKNSLIFEYYPFLKSKDDVKKLADFMYKNKITEIENAKKFILSKENILKKIAKQLAEIIETDWLGIENINIIPAICPVCPRFLESNSFMVTYFYNHNAILRICAHEMTHFIYFKNLKSLYPFENIDTEYPSKDWLLSEMVAPILINSDTIQKLIKQKDEFYSPSKIKNINQLEKQVKIEFDQRKNFADFIFNIRNIVAI
jgi:hypothetical protein